MCVYRVFDDCPKKAENTLKDGLNVFKNLRDGRNNLYQVQQS